MTQAASRDNLHLVQRVYAHFRETGEFDPADFHPDFVWDMSHFTGWPEAQTYHGVEGVRQFMDDWIDVWDEWEWEIRSIHEAGDKVVAVLHQAGRSKSSGVRVEMDFAQLFTVEGGRQRRLEAYADPAEALAAVGIER